MKSESKEIDSLAQYMKIVHQTMSEVNPKTVNALDENAVEKGFKNLVDFGLPFEIFQKFHSSSKFSLLLFASNDYTKDFLRSHFHTVKLVFGQEFNNYREFYYIKESSVQRIGRTAWIPLPAIQKVEKLYGLKRSSQAFYDLLADVFASNKTYRTAASKCLHITSLLFLVQHYGEDIISEILTKIIEEEVFCSAIDVESLTKNWMTLKEYPLHWALELTREGTQNNEE